MDEYISHSGGSTVSGLVSGCKLQDSTSSGSGRTISELDLEQKNRNTLYSQISGPKATPMPSPLPMGYILEVKQSHEWRDQSTINKSATPSELYDLRVMGKFVRQMKPL